MNGESQAARVTSHSLGQGKSAVGVFKPHSQPPRSQHSSSAHLVYLGLATRRKRYGSQRTQGGRGLTDGGSASELRGQTQWGAGSQRPEHAPNLGQPTCCSPTWGPHRSHMCTRAEASGKEAHPRPGAMVARVPRVGKVLLRIEKTPVFNLNPSLQVKPVLLPPRRRSERKLRQVGQ